LEDWDEIHYIKTDPADDDSDNDNLSDGEEVVNGNDGYITDPNKADTDEDGYSDGLEATFGTNPNDPNSYPPPPTTDTPPPETITIIPPNKTITITVESGLIITSVIATTTLGLIISVAILRKRRKKIA